MTTTEKNMVKAYRDLSIPDKRRSDNHFGSFQGATFEFLRTLEQKERNHVNFNRYLDSIVGKAEQIAKQYRADEKVFLAGIQKIAKEVVNQNEKLGKQTVSQEK
jgi:hypothetical protein